MDKFGTFIKSWSYTSQERNPLKNSHLIVFNHNTIMLDDNFKNEKYLWTYGNLKHTWLNNSNKKFTMKFEIKKNRVIEKILDIRTYETQ